MNWEIKIRSNFYGFIKLFLKTIINVWWLRILLETWLVIIFLFTLLHFSLESSNGFFSGECITWLWREIKYRNRRFFKQALECSEKLISWALGHPQIKNFFLERPQTVSFQCCLGAFVLNFVAWAPQVPRCPAPLASCLGQIISTTVFTLRKNFFQKNNNNMFYSVV